MANDLATPEWSVGGRMTEPLLDLSVASSIRNLLQIAGERLATDGPAAKQLIDRAIALLNTAPVRTAPPLGRHAPTNGLAPWQVRRVCELIDKRLESPLSTVQLSGSVNLSAGYFCHAFKRSFGVSPHAYVIAKRVERAQRMMLTTDESLSQIAVSCGLADQSHLSRVFRRALGYSPSTWRRHCRNNPSGAQSPEPAARPVGAFH